MVKSGPKLNSNKAYWDEVHTKLGKTAYLTPKSKKTVKKQIVKNFKAARKLDIKHKKESQKLRQKQIKTVLKIGKGIWKKL